MTKKSTALASSRVAIPIDVIERRIYLLRGQKVMLSPDLADLYRVEPRALVQAVKRNIERFPADFMFQLTRAEYSNLKSQIVISSWGGIRRAAPYAFTEHGVLMLSSVLSSRRAIQLNIGIMRAFVRLREVLATHRELAAKLHDLERIQRKHGSHIDGIWDAIQRLVEPPLTPKRKIGFSASARKETIA